MIRTYQERGTFSDPGLQMAVPFPLPPSGHFNYRGCDFFTEVLCDADPNQFRHILSRKKAFTTLYVLTGHNNRSDAFPMDFLMSYPSSCSKIFFRQN